jgi:hypothetical protein
MYSSSFFLSPSGLIKIRLIGRWFGFPKSQSLTTNATATPKMDVFRHPRTTRCPSPHLSRPPPRHPPSQPTHTIFPKQTHADIVEFPALPDQEEIDEEGNNTSPFNPDLRGRPHRTPDPTAHRSPRPVRRARPCSTTSDNNSNGTKLVAATRVITPRRTTHGRRSCSSPARRRRSSVSTVMDISLGLQKFLKLLVQVLLNGVR